MGMYIFDGAAEGVVYVIEQTIKPQLLAMHASEPRGRASQAERDRRVAVGYGIELALKEVGELLRGSNLRGSRWVDKVAERMAQVNSLEEFIAMTRELRDEEVTSESQDRKE